jgi:hypothetical protein
MAWFPLTFYATVYIGDLYKRAHPFAYADLETLRLNTLDRDAEATRLGFRALLYSSLITTVLIWLLPAFVATPANERSHTSSHDYKPLSTNVTDDPVFMKQGTWSEFLIDHSPSTKTHFCPW